MGSRIHVCYSVPYGKESVLRIPQQLVGESLTALVYTLRLQVSLIERGTAHALMSGFKIWLSDETEPAEKSVLGVEYSGEGNAVDAMKRLYSLAFQPGKPSSDRQESDRLKGFAEKQKAAWEGRFSTAF